MPEMSYSFLKAPLSWLKANIRLIVVGKRACSAAPPLIKRVNAIRRIVDILGSLAPKREATSFKFRQKRGPETCAHFISPCVCGVPVNHVSPCDNS